MAGLPTPESINAAWLTERLREAGHRNAEVRSFTRRQIGTGQIGKCVRFELELAAGGDDVPRSLVGKFPSDDPLSQSAGVDLGNYHREIRFYQELAPRLGISVPRCYFADIIGHGPEFALLLEDMAPAEQGDQLTGCTPEVARGAVLELVGLQAPTWNDFSLTRHDWLHAPFDPDAMRQSYADYLTPFLERYGSRLENDEVAILSRVAEAPACPLFAPLGDVCCLEHVDYRLDNMLIDHRVTPPRVTVVDWQSLKVGKPLNDVAYFLGAGLLPETRREVERDIVGDYHTALVEAGVTGFSWERCWEEYRRGAFSGFGVTVIASMIVQQTERGDAMFLTMARRHSRHALDLGADEFLI